MIRYHRHIRVATHKVPGLVEGRCYTKQFALHRRIPGLCVAVEPSSRHDHPPLVRAAQDLYVAIFALGVPFLRVATSHLVQGKARSLLAPVRDDD